MILRQMDDGFRIRIGIEHRAFAGEFILQFEKIFHDAVMHHHHLAGVADMRMGISGRRRAVRCPARVPDARRSIERGAADQIHQLR